LMKGKLLSIRKAYGLAHERKGKGWHPLETPNP
jgi:hypothetical protein